jgi:hypothetical protein
MLILFFSLYFLGWVSLLGLSKGLVHFAGLGVWFCRRLARFACSVVWVGLVVRGREEKELPGLLGDRHAPIWIAPKTTDEEKEVKGIQV